MHIVSPQLTTQNFSLPVCVHSHFWPRWQGHELWVHSVRERERERERVDSGVTSDYPQSSTVLSRLCPSLTFLTGDTLNLAWKFVGTCREGSFYRMWFIGPAFDSKCWHGHRTTKDDKCCPAFGKCQCFYCFMQPNTDYPWLLEVGQRGASFSFSNQQCTWRESEGLTTHDCKKLAS